MVTVGHSRGSGLATLAAIRYAGIRPAMRVGCVAFGAPRVGHRELRREAHCLPNLRMTRVSRDGDRAVDMPHGEKWEHVGHALRLSPSSSGTGGSAASGGGGGGGGADYVSRGIKCRWYRFGIDPTADCRTNLSSCYPSSSTSALLGSAAAALARAAQQAAKATTVAVVGGGGVSGLGLGLGGGNGGGGGGGGAGGGSGGGAIADGILSYASDLATLTSLPERFVGMEGDGVTAGDDNEIRHVV